jgi:hypothetical protein
MRTDALRGRLTYANVMATLALFVALGGASYAAIKLPPNSVTKKQITADAVRSSELAADSVDSSHITDGGVGGDDIANGSVGPDDLQNNSVGPLAIADNSVGPGELADDEAPAEPTLAECAPGTNWAPVQNNFLEPRFWMDHHGMVHLDGAVTCAAAATGGSTIFEMPFNYRPDQDVARFGVLGAGQSLAQVAVVGNPITAGVVYDGGTSATSDNYVSLDGITYRGEGPIP